MMISALKRLELLEDSIGWNDMLSNNVFLGTDQFQDAGSSAWASNPSFVVAPVPNVRWGSLFSSSYLSRVLMHYHYVYASQMNG